VIKERFVSTSSDSPAAPAAEPDLAPRFRAVPRHWLWVLCLLGVDYFSTLAYQPSIAFQAAGRLAPLATAVLVLVTLGCALPVYWHVAGRSAHGQGSIALLDQLIHGWRGKTLVLLLLGFAATDFIMLRTLSLADAAVHVRHNSLVVEQKPLEFLARQGREAGRDWLGPGLTAYFNEQLVVTLLLIVLGVVCGYLLRKGFGRKVLALAVPVVLLYLLLNAILLGCGLFHLARHPDRLTQWTAQIHDGDWRLGTPVAGLSGWLFLFLFAGLFLPHLALGLSGFEFSMILMPQVRGHPGEDPASPQGRVRNTRKILMIAALVMGAYLLASALVTSLLIPPEAFAPGGPADNRALAYLAHGGPLADGSGPAVLAPFVGRVFGSLYDLTTILLLGLAGSSVMAALASLLPQFLLRFGMEFRWVYRWGVLFILFGLINLVVTLAFRADVHDQRDAYATGVLALLTSAALVTCLDRLYQGTGSMWRRWPWGPSLAVAVFASAAVAVMVQSSAGLLISFGFLVALLTTSVFSRAIRNDELRNVGFVFADEESHFLWDSLRLAGFPVLVPHRPGRHEREAKEKTIREDHQIAEDAEIVFLEVEVDDPSEFYQRPLLRVFREDRRIVIKATRCASIAHTIAAIALELSRYSKPPGVHFGWSETDLLAASWSYLAFGEGNVPWKVRELILDVEPDPSRQPRIVVG
jgi:hypothetical protein